MLTGLGVPTDLQAPAVMLVWGTSDRRASYRGVIANACFPPRPWTPAPVLPCNCFSILEETAQKFSLCYGEVTRRLTPQQENDFLRFPEVGCAVLRPDPTLG